MGTTVFVLAKWSIFFYKLGSFSYLEKWIPVMCHHSSLHWRKSKQSERNKEVKDTHSFRNIYYSKKWRTLARLIFFFVRKTPLVPKQSKLFDIYISIFHAMHIVYYPAAQRPVCIGIFSSYINSNFGTVKFYQILLIWYNLIYKERN